MRLKKRDQRGGVVTYFMAGIGFLIAALVAFSGDHFPLAFALALGGVTPFLVYLLIRGELLTEIFTNTQVVIVRGCLVSLIVFAWAVAAFAFVRIA